MIITILVSVLIGYVYEDADSLIVIDDSLVICGIHQYNIKVHITNKGILKVTQWSGAADSTGWLLLNAPLILIQDSSSISGSELGYWGGDTSHTDGYGPGYGGAGSISGGGGGAGYGGDGGNGGDYGGAGGSAYGDPSDTLIEMGSGGGAGCYLYVVDGFGGSGGAMTCLKAQQIIVDSSYIEANGEDGHVGTLVGFEAGGGGSGGGIMIWADSAVIHNSVMDANGGNGANSEFGGGGGAGGGRIKIFYTTSLDTSGLILSVEGGTGGIGFQGIDGDSGMVGSIHIDSITGITEIANKVTKKFFIHPNPAKDIVNITCANTPLKLHLYDISGRIVKTIWLKNNTEFIRLNDLEQGIYFLKSNEENKPAHKIILLK